MSRLLLRAAAAGSLALAVTGCSLASTKVTPPPGVPAGVTSGGVLRIGVTAPAGLEPLAAYEPVGRMISAAMCDTLVDLDPQTGQVREALARGWVVSPDGKSITFKLRKGLTFSNGRAVTARDVNLTLQQLLLEGNASPLRDLLKPYSPAVVGAKTSQSVLADVGGKLPDVAQAINKTDTQVNAILKDSSGGQLRAFAEPGTALIDQSVRGEDSYAFSNNPVCVGPYRLAKPYVPGAKSLTLVRTQGYYGKNVGYTGGGAGYPDRLVFTIYPTESQAVSAYLAGAVDVVPVTRDQVSRFSRTTSDLVLGTANQVQFLGMPDGGQSPLSDAQVRTALSLALDRSKLARTYYGVSGLPADSFSPPAVAITSGPSLEGKTEKAAPTTTCGAATPSTPQVAKARALLAAAQKKPDGVKLGGALTLTVNDDAPFPQLAAEVASEWKSALGIVVQVKTMPWLQYSAIAGQGQGFDGAFRMSWSSDAAAPGATFNDQAQFLAPLFSSDASGTSNWSHYASRDVDFGLSKVAAKLSDVQQRGIAFQTIGTLLCRDMPMLPVVFERPVFAVRSSKVGSAITTPVSRNGVLMLRELYLKR